jgi:hypothetical protein
MIGILGVSILFVFMLMFLYEDIVKGKL